MIRLIVSILCAVGLALAPATAEAAAMAGSMPGCTMGKEMPAKSTDRGNMDCCTPACQVSAPALLPNSTGEEASSQPERARFAAAPEKKLASVPATGLDPPPRG
jgi:hypothetical protein